MNKNRIVSIGYIVVMVICIVMLNSSGNKTEEKHGSIDQNVEPVAHKEVDEPDAKTPKQEYLTQVVEKIASTDHGATQKTEEEKNPLAAKISPDVAIAKLQQGNIRFAKGESKHPNIDAQRRLLAATESQADHAFATVLTCSDSRVPVEAIFDAGVMDIFVVRVAGNVCDVDERGSIEYGIAHVHTPVVVIMGHTQCGAVTAVTQAIQGHGHELERNIPDLVANIEPAVKKAMELNPDVKGKDIIPIAIEENIWTSIEELFMQSPVTREFVSKGYVKVVGAIYDIGTGNINWLPEDKTLEILAKVETSPDKAEIKDEAAKEAPKAADDGAPHENGEAETSAPEVEKA